MKGFCNEKYGTPKKEIQKNIKKRKLFPIPRWAETTEFYSDTEA